jgi:hypothetical protein
LKAPSQGPGYFPVVLPSLLYITSLSSLGKAKKCVDLNFPEFAFSDVPVENIESGKYEVYKN